MEFRILGPLEVVDGQTALPIPTGQQRSLLALLILNANRVLSADWIAERLWEGRLPASGTKALAFHISKLRDVLSPGRAPGGTAGGLDTESGGYVLRVDPEAIDAIRFERLVRTAHRQLAGDPSGARDTLVEALGLWRGDALADVAYVDFAQAEIRRLDELRLGAVEDRLEAELELGGHFEALGELEVLAEENPLRERLRALLMLALYRSGRQSEALRVAGTLRRQLSEELGIDPSPELAQLEARILAQDPTLALPRLPRPAATLPRNPYKGLRPFCEPDAADFFGREALVGRLIARVEEAAHGGRFLALVGPSGSGKSSVVRAGLIPALRAGAIEGSAGWRIVTMVPGTDPFRELAAAIAGRRRRRSTSSAEAAERSGDLTPLLDGALAAGEPRLLVVIDQFEELFVRVDERVRARFLAALGAALATPSSPLIVVATLRADYLHVPLALPSFGDLLRGAVELVTPLSRDELERAIVRPAEAVGIEIEPALTAEMIADVERRPAALPLLEYALTTLFERGDGRRITREGYEAIGGVAGALGLRAEEAWRSLDVDGARITEQLLLRLVTVTDTGATSALVPRAELASIAADAVKADAVLDELGGRGLLTFDRDRVTGAPTVEIAHEALLTHWPRLAALIEDRREDLWIRRRMAEAASEWEAAERAPEFLASGGRLERFETWERGTRLRLSDVERAYLEASSAEQARVARHESERVAREHDLERRARAIRGTLAAVLVVGIVVAGTLTVALLGERQSGAEAASVAHAQELAATSVDKEQGLAILLALHAANTTKDRGYVVEEAYDALQWALQDAQVAFPSGDLPIGVRQGPHGPRGVFLVAPEILMQLGTKYVDTIHRQLSLAECATYLRGDLCTPVTPPGPGEHLKVRTVAGTVAVSSLAAPALTGTHVRVLSELPADISPLDGPFEEASGVSLDWDAAAHGNLGRALEAGDLPDVAIVARPSFVSSAARAGRLVELTGRIGIGSLADADPYILSLGRPSPIAGSGARAPAGLYGIPIAATVDDLLWYPRSAFVAAGYEPPKTPDQLTALLLKVRADGGVPWCFGTEAGATSGAAAAAWVADLFLDAHGTSEYDRWTRGELTFGSSEVRAEVEGFGRSVMGAGSVYNGLASALRTPEQIAALPMVALNEPGCWLYRGSSADRPRLAARASVVPFPGSTDQAHPVLGRLYLVVMLHDRPEVRRVIETLVGPRFASAMASAVCRDGVFPVRNGPVPAECVEPADGARLRASLAAGTFRVRADDLFPQSVASAFLGDLTDYLDFERPTTENMDFAADAVWNELRSGTSR